MNSHDTIYSLLQSLVGGGVSFSFDQPEEITHGDYATNIAFILAKEKKIQPKQCAEELVVTLSEKLSSVVSNVDVAGPGFINFFLKDDVRTDEVEEIATHGVLTPALNEKVIVEYTDPNPFKVFHIGHIVPNTIGESLSRLYEAKGYDVTRICYQGDVGMHVATTIWGLLHSGESEPEETSTLREKVAYLGRAYAYGTVKLSESDTIKQEVTAINKAVFMRSDEAINGMYDLGKKWSLDYFETIYQKLGTTFDHYIFESEVGDEGVRIVKENTPTIFQESDGAIVFKGEDIGLHTRVFVNSQGLPTYEAKEIGNTYKKASLIPEVKVSVVVTAKEIDDYFKVIKVVLGMLDKKLGDTLLHVSHGMLRLPEGKMSSRKGNVIPAEELIDLVSERIVSRLEDMKVSDENKAGLVNDIAVGAIKFSILKSAPGKDMIFDFEKSISFEGDSGPYLQYTHARLSALLDKAKEATISFDHGYVVASPEKELEKVILGYRETLEKAYSDVGPHHIVQYLLLLTRVFNNMYARVQIVNIEDKDASSYYVMLATATRDILAHGLYTLGIKAPERM